MSSHHFSIGRYQAIDEYTLEELRRRYTTLNPAGRVRLLRRLARQSIPPSIAQLATDDPDPRVRQWLARRGPKIEGVTDRLLDDPDPFVRACCRENATFFNALGWTRWEEWLESAAPLDRLALVRNPEVPPELIARVFDPQDEGFGLDTSTREALVMAVISNRAFLRRIKQTAGLAGRRFPDDGWVWYQANKCLATIWRHASSDLPRALAAFVYLFVPAGDEARAQAYRAEAGSDLEHIILRTYILRTCEPEGVGYRQTLALGAQDEDRDCRRLAYAGITLDDKAVDDILSGTDTAALWGLGLNRFLSIERLKQVAERLASLEDASRDDHTIPATTEEHIEVERDRLSNARREVEKTIEMKQRALAIKQRRQGRHALELGATTALNRVEEILQRLATAESHIRTTARQTLSFSIVAGYLLGAVFWKLFPDWTSRLAAVALFYLAFVYPNWTPRSRNSQSSKASASSS